MTNTELTGMTSTITLEPAQVERLKELYSFREPAEDLQFLEKYPFLVPLLLEAHQPIRKYFPDSPLFLEVVTDPEARSRDEDMLWIYIGTHLDSEEAIDTLERLDDDWWLDAEPQAQGKMFINIDRLDNGF